MKLEIFPTKNKQHAVRLRARNGRIILQSETYKRVAGAEHLAMLIAREINTLAADAAKPRVKIKTVPR